MGNRYIFFAIITIITISILYAIQFWLNLGFSISEKTEVWGQLGDYFGGILNPILSFISIVLLVKSLTIQKGIEKFKNFEVQFFNMIESQRNNFSSFKIEHLSNSTIAVEHGVDAVIFIEDAIHNIKNNNGTIEDIVDFLNEMDGKDQIYGVVRIFNNTVKLISEKLSTENGFSEEERVSQIITLINFTDYALIRLIMISMQFMESYPITYLKENKDLNSALNKVELAYNIY